MKLLVAYDGSKCSEAAIDDLARAGLPETGEAVVLSVSEKWLAPSGNDIETADPYLEELTRQHREKAEKALADARTYADRAADRLRRTIPQWKISAEATYGSPAWEILAKADQFLPDLIVVGSHGHSALSRLVLGSISQKVLTEARCSVRIARGRIDVDSTPVRIVIAFDCSEGAKLAVQAAAKRRWPDGSEYMLVAVADPVSPSFVGQFIPPIAEAVDELNEAEKLWIVSQAEEHIAALNASGLSGRLKVVSGNPKHLIIDEAEKWNADCIFAGANAAGSRIERFLLGSTSAAVAARAHCSVEVVRKAR